MKNKNMILALVGLVLIGIGAYLYFNQSKSTYEAGEKDFGMADTSGVDKIFLADKSGLQTTLEKEGVNRWKVNGKYTARIDMLENLFDVIKRISVRAPVANSASENILKRLATNNIKVEIYRKGELAKVYYVGGGTADNYGSFALMDGSENPYICYLPGHNGYLTNFYNPNPLEWRDRLIFAMSPRDIRSVRVEYTYEPQAGYTVEQPERSIFVVKNAMGESIPFDTNIVKAYLLEFKNIAYESFVDIPKSTMDSIASKYNLFTLHVTDVSGKTTVVKGHRIKLMANTYNEFGKEVEYDDNRMYGEINSFGEEYIFLQYLTFDRILKTPAFFQGN